MVALLTFLSSPNDDLALAQVLKSPLFNASDDVLLSIRFCKMEGTWWQRLQTIKTPATVNATAKIAAWLQAMDTLPVHDLLDRVFHEADVLNAYARAVPQMMRASVIANLNAFMALALEVDSGRFPSLTRFLNELKRFHALPDNEAPDVGAVLDDKDSETEIDSSINAVRLMTIHAAKGLESPIVWLIDADDVSNKTDSHTVLSDWQPDDVAPRHFSFWAIKALAGKDRAAILEVEANVDAREKLNLLYVAATRAKQYLVVSGTARKNALDTMSWHDRALKVCEANEASWPLAAEQRMTSNELKGTSVDVQPRTTAAWMLPMGARTPLALANSKREKGIEIHAALELMAQEKTSSSANAKRSKQFPADITAAAKKILNAPALQRFFESKQFITAHNEIEIAMQVNGELVMQRIDRLVEFEREVWVLDYKTGSGNMDLHHAQIAAYCDAVMPLYKNKTVRGAVIDLAGELHVLR
jgi:ATP-dependent helicase/nuclease subunit A